MTIARQPHPQPIIIRPALMRFAEHMEIVLRRNDKKKSWENCTYEYLLDGIERETKELRECFWYPDGRSELFGIVGDDFLVSNRFTEDQVLSECADVANFAMMVFDVLMQREYKNDCTHTSAHAPAFKRCCDSCINVPCKVLNRIPCLAQEKQENICEENGCTDIENCDEICQHSRLFSPLQMQEAKKQAAKAARDQMLDEIISGFQSNPHFPCAVLGDACPNPLMPCRDCTIKYLESLRHHQEAEQQ
jgi:hypothetical protein